MKWIAIFFLVLVPSLASADIQLEVPLHSGGYTIDGKITADEKALSASDALRMATGYERPANATQFYVGSTLHGMYVAFDCDEKNTSEIVIIATPDQGAVFEDDSVQVFLCAEREINNSNYYHFAVNAAGVKYGSGMEPGSPVQNWDARTLKTSNGWSAELYIPYNSIDAPQELKFWRANFVRNRPAREKLSEEAELTSWQQVGSMLHNFQRFGFLKMPRLVPPPPPPPTGAAPQ